jgi:hypothetical protein
VEWLAPSYGKIDVGQCKYPLSHIKYISLSCAMFHPLV